MHRNPVQIYLDLSMLVVEALLHKRKTKQEPNKALSPTLNTFFETLKT